MDALRNLGVGVVTLALIIVVAVGGYNILALNLGIVSGDYFKGALAVLVLLVSVWLIAHGQGMFGKPFLFAALLCLVVITVRHRSPGIANLVAASGEAISHKADEVAVDINAARELPCDRTTPKLKFFDRPAGRQLVWAAEDEDGRLYCFDRPGHHPQTDKVLVAVDKRLAVAILRQEPPAQPQPVPVVVQSVVLPVPQPRPTPLPELGQGTIRELGEGPIR